MVILTLTPNPSLDLLFGADRLVWDDANRIPLPRRRPGGQGVNLVRAARAVDRSVQARAIALLGGATGRDLEASLEAEGTPLRAVPAPAETRVFVGVREAETGRSLLLNPRGAEAGEAEAEALLVALGAELDAAERSGRTAWLACCGSLPPGLAADLYARAGHTARTRGHRFVPDCDGEALRLAAAESDLLVPNVHEAERLLSREIHDREDAVHAARALLELGPRVAVVTLGAGGAVAATREGGWVARPDLTPGMLAEAAEGSAVGAGDALLAALLLGLGASEPGSGSGTDLMAGALRDGVAAGTAVLLGRGTELLTREAFGRVRDRVRVAEVRR